MATPLPPDDGATASEPEVAFNPALAAGAKVGAYVIEAKLGEGAFGAVYRAVHAVIGKVGAIKVLNRAHSGDPEMVARFVAEARAVNKIRHKNIVDIFAFGELDDGRRYFVMELLEGRPLDAVLRDGPLPPERALPLLAGVARALVAAHAAEVVHRDLKPANIFVVDEPDGGVSVKLLDFGIAKLLGDNQATTHTRTGVAIGTPFYMSPEQARGTQIDCRSDVFSFGVVLYRTLTGKLPFTGSDWVEVLYKTTSQDPVPPRQVNPALSPELERAILRMLAKDREQRPQSVAEVLEELSAAAQTMGVSLSVTADGTAPLPPAPEPPRAPEPEASPRTISAITSATRNAKPAGLSVRWPAMLAALAAGGLLVAGAVALLGRRPQREPSVQAPVASAQASATATAAATSAAVVSVAPLAEVAVRVLSTPPGAEVWLDDTLLGVAPGPIKLPRGPGTRTLTLKAQGYTPETIEVSAEDDGSVSIKLTKAQVWNAPKGKGKLKDPRGELESPF